jgi:hypothetical protein
VDQGYQLEREIYMSNSKPFEYVVSDGTRVDAVAVMAGYNGGRAVLIEFLSPIDSAIRRMQFVIYASDPGCLAFANDRTADDLIEHAIKRFQDEKWGDCLAPASAARSDPHCEPIV